MRSIFLIAFLAVFAASRALAAEAPKPWADDPARFLSTPDHAWIIGCSTGPCLSAAEATEQACRDATQQLAAMLQPSLRSTHSEKLTRQLFADLSLGQLVRDRSVSRIQKPYGELWSAAILVDASPAQLSSIAARYSNALKARQRILAVGCLVIAALFVATLLAYAAVNAATKGYFRGRLRAMAAMSLLVLACGMVGLLAAAG